MAWVALLCERPLWKGLAAGAALGLDGTPARESPSALTGPWCRGRLTSLENALPVEPDIERRDDPRAARLRVREGNSASVKSA